MCELSGNYNSTVSVIVNMGRVIIREDFTKIELTVTGDGMKKVTVETTGSSLEVKIPEGLDRTFSLKGVLVNGIVITGSKVSDIRGSSVTVTIDLTDYDLSEVPLTNIDTTGNFGLSTSLATALSGSEFFLVGDNITFTANPGEDALYYQWLSGDSQKAVVASKTTAINVTDHLKEGGTYHLTYRVYLKDKIVDETIIFVLVSPNLIGGSFSTTTTTTTAIETDAINDIYVNDDETKLFVYYKPNVSYTYLHFEAFDLTSPALPLLYKYDFLDSMAISPIKIEGYTHSDGRELIFLLYGYNSDVSFATFDVTDSSPITTGFTVDNGAGLFGQPEDLYVIGNRLFIASSTGGDPKTNEYTISENPPGTIEIKNIGEYAPNGNTIVGDRFLFLGDSNEPQSVYSVGNSLYAYYPSNTTLLMIQPVGYYNEIIDMVYNGRYLYAVGQVGDEDVNYEFQIFEPAITDLTRNLVGVGNLTRDLSADASTSYKGIDISSNSRYAAIADYTGGLRVFNIERASIPIQVYQQNISSGANNVIIGNNKLYLSSVTDKKVYVIPHNF